ncbi:MAG: hypothetical protein ACKV0T_13525 [Planctomycetales bacterium]
MQNSFGEGMMERGSRVGVIRALRIAVRGWFRHDGSVLSAALAYYASLSLFPILLVLIAGLGYLSRISPALQG